MVVKLYAMVRWIYCSQECNTSHDDIRTIVLVTWNNYCHVVKTIIDNDINNERQYKKQVATAAKQLQLTAITSLKQDFHLLHEYPFQ